MRAVGAPKEGCQHVRSDNACGLPHLAEPDRPRRGRRRYDRPDPRPATPGLDGGVPRHRRCESATGFALPFTNVLPSHIVGGIALVVLAVALLAQYGFHLAGAWRWIYAS